MDLYEYKQLKKNNLFPFSVIEFCEVIMFNRLGHNMCDRKLGFIFFSCDLCNLLSDYYSVPYNMSEYIFCLGLRLLNFR